MWLKQDEPPLRTYFNHYFDGLKIGLVTSITGGTGLKTGTGKSYTSLRMGEILDDDFNINKVSFSPREFLMNMDAIEASGKPGQILTMDEGEIAAPSNLWYSFSNKAISYSLATFRYLRSMAIFVTPSLFWIDKRVRTLTSHWGYSTMYLQARTPIVDLHLYRLKTDLFGEKIFFKKLTFYDPLEKRELIASSFKVGLPSQELIDAYEKKSMLFKKNIRASLVADIDKIERTNAATAEKESTKAQPIKVFTDKLLANQDVQAVLKEKGKVDAALVRFVLQDVVSQNMAVNLSRAVNLLWTRKPMD